MTPDELRNMTWSLAVAHEVLTNHGKSAYGNEDHFKYVKEELLKISEMLNKQRLEMVLEEKGLTKQ